MATPITKNVTRRCPEILSAEGRQLDVRLHDEDDGSVTVKWVGLRADAEKTFSLRELAEFEAEEQESTRAPAKESDEQIKFTDLLSQIHIAPGITLDERKRLVDLATGIRDRHVWLRGEKS